MSGRTRRPVPDAPAAGRVPFHKLSQWLTYSLLEPFEWAGIAVERLDALTGLPEYRNGGLLIDGGALVPLAADPAARPRTVDDPWVIEWRALTVALLDDRAAGARRAGRRCAAVPLACMLEGGRLGRRPRDRRRAQAGRRAAAAHRQRRHRLLMPT